MHNPFEMSNLRFKVLGEFSFCHFSKESPGGRRVEDVLRCLSAKDMGYYGKYHMVSMTC